MINILPYNQKKMVERLRIAHVAIVTLWAIIILFGIGMLLLMPLLVTINSRYGIATDQIKKLEESGMVVSPINVASFESRARILSEKLAGTAAPAPTMYIKGVQQAVLAGISLSGFAMQNTSAPALEVTGRAGTREALQRFIAALEANEMVASVESPVSNFVKSTNSQFTLTITFK